MVFDETATGISSGGLAPSNDFHSAGSFKSAAALPVTDALANLIAAAEAYKQSIGAFPVETTPADISHHMAALSAIQTVFNESGMDYYLKSMETILHRLGHAEGSLIGEDFIAAYKKAECHFTVSNDDKDAAQANYAAYHLGRGRINEVMFNPGKIDLTKFHMFFGSFNHETFHGLQNTQKVMQHVPWNRDTQIVIHPLDKMRLDNLCERDAYAKQALMNVLLLNSRPGDQDFRTALLEDTRYQLISTQDMQTIMSRHPRLQRAVTEAALIALNKPMIENEVGGRTFHDSYFDVSLKDYRAAMEARTSRGLSTALKYVRLDDADFHSIGNYGVGPNSLGADRIDPRFVEPIRPLDEELDALDQLCHDYDIPLLQHCPTLRSCTTTSPSKTQRAERPFSLTAPSFITSEPAAPQPA